MADPHELLTQVLDPEVLSYIEQKYDYYVADRSDVIEVVLILKYTYDDPQDYLEKITEYEAFVKGISYIFFNSNTSSKTYMHGYKLFVDYLQNYSLGHINTNEELNSLISIFL